MKSKNILLSAGRMTAKIADVGLARYMAQTHMDTKSLPMGTFVYAAPELLLGRRSDHKVWQRPILQAVGCQGRMQGCWCPPLAQHPQTSILSCGRWI
jgi:serine/threonine protein kinase